MFSYSYIRDTSKKLTNIFSRLGWGIIILMGGGFALAEGMDK